MLGKLDGAYARTAPAIGVRTDVAPGQEGWRRLEMMGLWQLSIDVVMVATSLGQIVDVLVLAHTAHHHNLLLAFVSFPGVLERWTRWLLAFPRCGFSAGASYLLRLVFLVCLTGSIGLSLSELEMAGGSGIGARAMMLLLVALDVEMMAFRWRSEMAISVVMKNLLLLSTDFSCLI